MKKIRPLAEQLARRLDKSGGLNACWPWQGTVNGGGYGKITVETGLRRYTHRVAWELANGEIPKGMFVLHHCDNPPCCNPSHLWLGDDLANSNDKIAKDRQNRGEKNGQAKLTEAQVMEIRSSQLLQHELAKKFGVSRPLISQIRRGKIWVKSNKIRTVRETLA